MRKKRGWSGINQISSNYISKPTSVNYIFENSILFIKWVPSIGKVDGYKIYGGHNRENLEIIGNVNTNQFTKNINKNENNYYIAISAYFQNNESEITTPVCINKNTEFTINDTYSKRDIDLIEQISKPINFDNSRNIEKTFYQKPEKELKQNNISYPYGLCNCCPIPQPLMKRKNNIVCSNKINTIYIQKNEEWIQKPQEIISDVEQIDELLKMNSAYVGLGGVFIQNN